MAKQVQLRRGDASDHATFTGAIGELTYVSDDKTLRIHDGSTAGGINVLAGVGSMNIRQIVTATQAESSHTINHATDPAVVCGVYVTITPKSTSSKIILAGRLRATSYDADGNSVGHVTNITTGNTADVGEVHDGTSLSGTYEISLLSAEGLTSNYYYSSQNMFFVHSPSTTSEVRYDWVLRNYYAANQTEVYRHVDWSSLYAIEIG